MTSRMTHVRRGPATCPGPRAGIPAAAIAVLLLAGCSSGNVGDSWQCPLATGGSCDSVAAADPAVPDPGAARNTLLTEPLWQQRAGAPGTAVAAPCESGCDGGFDPFGWLTRLFRADAREPETGTADGAVQKPEPAAGETVAAPSATGPGEALSGKPEAAPLPADTVPAQDKPAVGDLRTGEVVARIWIAPFVDADGVYREASHVRVVLEPAGWRVR